MIKSYPLPAFILLSVASAYAVDGTWNTPTGDGVFENWSNASFWESGTVASGTNATASFEYFSAGGSGAAFDAYVTLDTDVTIGNIFADGEGTGNAHNFLIAGPNRLILDTDTGSAPLIHSNLGNTRHLTINAEIAGNDGLDLSETNAGPIVLGGANSYQGETSIIEGEVHVNNGLAFGSTVGAGSDIVNLNSNGAIRLLDGVVAGAGETLHVSGNGTASLLGALHAMDGDSAEWAGDVFLEGSTRVGTQGGATLEISGAISGASNRSFSLSHVSDAFEQGTLILSGANDYAGATFIYRGRMQLADGDNRLPTTTTVQLGQVSTNSELDLNGTNQSLVGIYNNTGGSSDRTITNSDAGNASVLTLTGSTDRSFMSGANNNTFITGNLSIVQNGSGNFTLGETNTFTGDVTVNNGTVTLADGSTITFYIEGDGVNNGFDGTGDVDLNGMFSFDLTGADDTAGNSWTIVASSLTESYGASFGVQGFTDDGSGLWSFGNYQFSEATGMLSVVPEPSTYALLIGAVAFLFIARRRRRA